MANPALAEISGHVGYDFAIIDNEHSIGKIKDVANMLRAFGALETTAMVRVPGQNPDYLKRVFDTGAQALMIPMIETADQEPMQAKLLAVTHRWARVVARLDWFGHLVMAQQKIT